MAAPRKATALYNYTPDEPDELELHAGDVVCVTREQDDGWCLGFLESSPSDVGLFPSNYIQDVSPSPPSTISALPPSHLPSYRPAAKPAPQTIARRARAAFDYLPREPDELTLRAGDVVVVVENLDDGWCRGYLSSDPDHHEGLFPANYVDMQDDSWTTTTGADGAKLASKNARRPSDRSVVDEPTDDEDPHWRHKLTKAPSHGAATPTPPIEAASRDHAETGYYDDQGNYVMPDGGYYNPEGLFFPKILDPTTTPAGYYDADGYYITDAGYFDLEGRFHANTQEDTAPAPTKDMTIGSVVQLKQALKRAKANADAAQAARLEAESQMQRELEARRRSERAAAVRVQRERDHEAQAKTIQQTIQAQIQKQLLDATTTPQRRPQGRSNDESVQHIQRWYRRESTRRRKRVDAAATRIQKCGRVYVTNRRCRQMAATSRQLRAKSHAVAAAMRPLTPERAAIRIQRRGRRYASRRRHQDDPAPSSRDKAARRLQRFWHVYRGKRRFQAVLDAVRQRRRNPTKTARPNLKTKWGPEHHNAARTVQRVWHVYRCKQRLHDVMALARRKRNHKPTTKEKPSGQQRRHKAASRLQKFWHVYRGRTRLCAVIALGLQKTAMSENVKSKPSLHSKNSAKKPVKPPFTQRHHHAARRLQRFWRVYLCRMHLQQVVAEVRRRRLQRKAIPQKPAPVRPQRLDSSSSTPTLVVGHVQTASASLLPIFTTDVAQISQLATLIANSVNVELSKRMRAHDVQLDRLVTSVAQLQKAIDKHNGSLERVFADQDRPPPIELKGVLPSTMLPSLAAKPAYYDTSNNMTVTPAITTGLYYSSSPTKQLRPSKVQSKLPQHIARASKLPVLRSPTKARTKWPSNKHK